MVDVSGKKPSRGGGGRKGGKNAENCCEALQQYYVFVLAHFNILKFQVLRHAPKSPQTRDGGIPVRGGAGRELVFFYFYFLLIH